MISELKNIEPFELKEIRFLDDAVVVFGKRDYDLVKIVLLKEYYKDSIKEILKKDLNDFFMLKKKDCVHIGDKYEEE